MFYLLTSSFKKMLAWICFILTSLGLITFDTVDSSASRPIKIGAFNIQIFGTQKLANRNVFDILVKIVLRYDILLVQEIRDNSNNGIQIFMEEVNRKAKEELGESYSCVISPRLGRTVSKEQYAFIYRQDRVSITSSYVFDDGDEETGKDLFQREPYLVKVHSPTSAVSTFGMIGIHTQPDDAEREISNLVDVYENMSKKWKLTSAIILGDFNAACGYVRKKAWPSIPLFTDKRFTWLFENSVDTTSGPSNCAYDRMVVAGTKMKNAIVPGSANVFHYDEEYKLTQEEALAISDHYPIEVEIKAKSLKRPARD